MDIHVILRLTFMNIFDNLIVRIILQKIVPAKYIYTYCKYIYTICRSKREFPSFIGFLHRPLYRFLVFFWLTSVY